jgi:hypothetical protein
VTVAAKVVGQASYGGAGRRGERQPGNVAHLVKANVEAGVLRAGLTVVVSNNASIGAGVDGCGARSNVEVVEGGSDEIRSAAHVVSAAGDSALRVHSVAEQEVVVLEDKPAAVADGDRMAGDNGVGDARRAGDDVDRRTGSANLVRDGDVDDVEGAR